MNGLVSFNLCTLTDNELVAKVDQMTDEMYQTSRMPNRHIPAQPNEDYDLLVGELVKRFMQKLEIQSKDDNIDYANRAKESIKELICDCPEYARSMRMTKSEDTECTICGKIF